MVSAAPACRAALAQATARWPGRVRLSDGIVASPAHTAAAPTSDHELGNAFDLTHDPAHGVDCHVLAARVIYDRRVKYVIWDRRIFNGSIAERWRAYDGPNPHTRHMHVSIRADCRDDTSPWWGSADDEEATVADSPDLPNIEGPLSFHPIVNQAGEVTGYYVFSTRTGELHTHPHPDHPGKVRYLGRSEDPTPG